MNPHRTSLRMEDKLLAQLIEELTLEIEFFHNRDIPAEARLPGSYKPKAILREAIELYYRKLGWLD